MLSLAFVSLASFLTRALGQSIPPELPGNWTSLGCYTDAGAPRTLGALVVINGTMTIEQCISICEAADYNLAGVEYGHCDSIIQVPGTQVEDTECSMACAGDATQVCGGPSRINVFDSGRPLPEIIKFVPGPQGTWLYTGCYSDTAASRTLRIGLAIPGGATVESCTAACMASSLGPFTLAGVENKNECWCGNELGELAEPDDDTACRGVCTADHSQLCGNPNRILIYAFNPSPEPEPFCVNKDAANFTLVAEYKIPVDGEPASVDLKVIAVEISRGVVWTLLSSCANCCSEWRTLSMENSIIFAHSSVVGTQIMSSTRPRNGESPAFVASVPAFPGFQAFCSEVDEVDPKNKPATLTLGGRNDAFALCVNNTADARVDLVFDPASNHSHYLLSSCRAVEVKIVTD